jgi:hypothetical protein
LPVTREKFTFELLQQAFGGANDIASALLLQEVNVFVADHTAIHHPDAVGSAITCFHLLDDFFHCGAIVTVTVKDFVAQGNAFFGDH